MKGGLVVLCVFAVYVLSDSFGSAGGRRNNPEQEYAREASANNDLVRGQGNNRPYSFEDTQIQSTVPRVENLSSNGQSVGGSGSFRTRVRWRGRSSQRRSGRRRTSRGRWRSWHRRSQPITPTHEGTSNANNGTTAETTTAESVNGTLNGQQSQISGYSGAHQAGQQIGDRGQRGLREGSQRVFQDRETAYDFLSNHGNTHTRRSRLFRERRRENAIMAEGMCEHFGKHFVPSYTGGRCV